MKTYHQSKMNLQEKLKNTMNYYENSNWFSLWINQKKISSNSLTYIYKPKNFKIRFLNYHFNQIYFSTYKDIIVLESNELGLNQNHIGWSTWKPLNDFIFDSQKKIYFNLQVYQRNYTFSLYHSYMHQGIAVLYSIPDAKTIVQAYNNDPTTTKYKLLNFCYHMNDAEYMIEQAKYILRIRG